VYSDSAADSSGRTREQAPSAPTSRLVTTVYPSAKAASAGRGPPGPFSQPFQSGRRPGDGPLFWVWTPVQAR
jgi:hypothetical protein